MRVVRDFDEVYATQPDPWSIGAADSGRYNLYRTTILRHTSGRGRILDIGCGYGAFLARFRDDFDELDGIEVARQAVDEGGRRYPFIRFRQGRADDLEAAFPEGKLGTFDCIVYSDVINYLSEAGKRDSLAWIADQLAENGLALVAAWSPGGKYLSVDELRRLVCHHFAIDHEQVLDSGHVLFACRARRTLVALTVDYETWQPIPAGREISWDRDILIPTAQLLDAADRQRVPITLMAEMGEWFWLKDNEPAVADRMAEQWAGAVRRGHDVQLHLHPAWLPDLGARRDAEGWVWDLDRSRVDDYPGDLVTLMERCVRDLGQVTGNHRVGCFRAGGYEAQPFARLALAMGRAGLWCDSSVLPGGPRQGRRFDYRLAPKAPAPWFASPWDPQLPAPSAERAIVELPIWTVDGQRWTFDGPAGARFVDDLMRSRDHAGNRLSSSSYRACRRAARRLRALSRTRPRVARWLPRRPVHAVLAKSMDGPRLTQDYHVLVGHSKADLDIAAIERGLERLASRNRLDVVTLSEMASAAREELDRVETGGLAAPPSPADDPVTARLIAAVPLDRRRVHQIGGRLADGWSRWPWLDLRTGELPEDPGVLDCVIADRVLEFERNPQRVLERIVAALAEGGVLVAVVHACGENLDLVCEEHSWRTEAQDVQRRFVAAGFRSVRVETLDGLRLTGRTHPPARDRLLLVRACREPALPDRLARVDELLRWAYDLLDPTVPAASADPLAIVAGGHAWCSGATIVLGEALRREGLEVRWVTMVAEGHERGRGERGEESHEVLELQMRDGSRQVIDASTGVRFPNSLETLLARPALATGAARPDTRWLERRYDLYATAYWYKRVRRVAIRADLRDPHRFIAVERLLSDPRVISRARVPHPKAVRLARAVWHHRVVPGTRRLVKRARARS